MFIIILGILSNHESSQIPMDAHLLKVAPSAMQPSVFKLVKVNFLGSPEVRFVSAYSINVQHWIFISGCLKIGFPPSIPNDVNHYKSIDFRNLSNKMKVED